MEFNVELESYLELGPDDEYLAPCQGARRVKNTIIYPGSPDKFDEPVYAVTINTLEELLDIAAAAGHPIEIEGRTITIKDRYY